MKKASPPSPERQPKSLLKVAGVLTFYVTLGSACAYAILKSLGPHGVESIVPAFLSLPPAMLGLSTLTVVIAFACLWFIEHIVAAGASKDSPSLGIVTPLIAIILSLGAGFGPLSGSAVRARLYRTSGIDLATAINIATTATLMLLMGGVVLAALGCAFGRLQITGVQRNYAVAPIAGWAILAVLLGLCLLAGRRGRELVIVRRTVRLPSSATLAFGIGLGAVNWIASALGLYVLLPELTRPSFSTFVTTVSTLKLGSLMTGSPGGLGVFEAMMMSMTNAQLEPDKLAAALVAYRIQSFVLPVCVALVGAAFIEARRKGAAHPNADQREDEGVKSTE